MNERSFGWRGERTRLIPLDESHFDLLYGWINDPEVTRTLLVGDYPMTRLAEREWFEQACKSSNENVYFVIATLDSVPLGVSGIHDIDFRHGTCRTGSYIGKKEEWGKGYGTDAARVRARYIFDVLGLRQIYSGAIEGNERSMRMQLRAGYEHVATFPKKYWKDGQFRDEYITLLTRERWHQLQSEVRE
ncbi:MAG: GNAT family protein [Fimbriimonadaceae bacterium]|nr:GNAT family protein [Fimbriimonadaceae bacterium]